MTGPPSQVGAWGVAAPPEPNASLASDGNTVPGLDQRARLSAGQLVALVEKYSQAQGSAYWVLRSIASYGTRSMRPYCFASLEQLAREARVSARTVRRDYRKLADLGELLVVERPPIRSEKWVLWQHWTGVPDPVEEIRALGHSVPAAGTDCPSRWVNLAQPKRQSEDASEDASRFSGQHPPRGGPQIDPRIDSPETLRAAGWRWVQGSGWMPPP